ncbi:MAG: hypothetical protein NC432_09490 [Roseburia sp.]|nr:hypothetical protein [Roseburia sp.]MCM1098210.1 hypothetical protein [Ruminococcus flavefaciens]
MGEESGKFEFTYSAGEQEEIRRIRAKYAPETGGETTMEHLRRLDASATRAAAAVSIILGTISTLIMGFGMCCIMVWGDTLFVPGIVIGIVGIAGVAAAYPVYTHMVKRRREKLTPEILRLTEELLK